MWSTTRNYRLNTRETVVMKKLNLARISVAILCLVACAVLQSHWVSAEADNTRRSGLKPIERILPYFDDDYGFEVAVPEHWLHNYAATSDEPTQALEPGYAVGFESPRSGANDLFADYLMIEILPGAHSGAFETDGSHTRVMVVDGRVAVVDRVNLDRFEIDNDRIDLVVFQAEIVELGFTVGIFVIGEQHEEAVLADAFELALKTFKVPDDPFSVS